MTETSRLLLIALGASLLVIVLIMALPFLFMGSMMNGMMGGRRESERRRGGAGKEGPHTACAGVRRLHQELMTATVKHVQWPALLGGEPLHLDKGRGSIVASVEHLHGQVHCRKPGCGRAFPMLDHHVLRRPAVRHPGVEGQVAGHIRRQLMDD